ncbi:MAG TPA: ferritin-like domain-containing protein, partial [Blastocatellia bacterium]|nr:ferritin-like domain-containing protein [Blastocatellia bacterium]
LMNSVGKSPSLSGENVPRYPGFIPHHAAGGPYLQLQAFSPLLMSTTFMPIEQPEASPKAPAEGDHYQTIGQFYAAIGDGFKYLVEKHGEKWVFGHDTGFQLGDTYFGSGGGHLFKVSTLDSALDAIREITQQGEGAAHPQPPVPGQEPYGGYEHYGPRLDGTYGPILGTPWEMSHYGKFRQLAEGTIPASPTYPMQANPDPNNLEGEFKDLSNLFNMCYTLVLRSLELALGTPTEQFNFFGVAFPVMHFALPPLATLLMQTPLERAADLTLGPTAGPSFQYCEATVSEMVKIAEALQAIQPERGAGYSQRIQYQQLWDQTLGSVLGVLQAIQKDLAHAGDRRL